VGEKQPTPLAAGSHTQRRKAGKLATLETAFLAFIVLVLA
jgi:hypothetical protein